MLVYVGRMESDPTTERRALCAIAVEAQALIRDGLSPKLTATSIRDKALAALGVRGDEAIRVLNGEIL